MAGKPRVCKSIAQVIGGDPAALGGLRKLAAAGCDTSTIMELLSAVRESHGLDTWESMVGRSRRQLEQLTASAEKLAVEVEGLYSSWAKNSFRHVGSSLRQFKGLPGTLNEFAATVRQWRKGVGPLRRPSHKQAYGRIVAYVKTTTGKYHDAEVAALIGAVVGDPNYDADLHRKWRSHAAICKPLAPNPKFTIQMPLPPPVPHASEE